MELSCMVFLDVKTVDDSSPPLQMSVEIHNGKRPAADIYKKVAKKLGLMQSSCEFFALHEGRKFPKQVYKQTDSIVFPVKNLCVQKWCYDIESERTVLFNYPMALHLLYLQAQLYIKSGKIKPTATEMRFLQEYETAEKKREFIELCQSVKDYTSVLIPQCSLIQEFSIQFYDIPKGATVDILIRQSGIKLIHVTNFDNENHKNDTIISPSNCETLSNSDCENNLLPSNCDSSKLSETLSDSDENSTCSNSGKNVSPSNKSHSNHDNKTDNDDECRWTHFIPWFLVKSWSHNRLLSSMRFEVRVRGQGFHYLMVKTEQAPYLLAVTMEMIKQLQKKSEESVPFHASMIRKDDDITHWDNVMYSPEKINEPRQNNNNR